MAAEQRKLLEQLMGDSHPTLARAEKVSITDPKTCKSYLVGTCPHDLFTNTKNDSGPCPRYHNPAQREEYRTADEEQKKKWSFEYDYLRDMQRYLDDCNRNIDRAQKRLEKTPEEIKQTMALLKDISELTKSIQIGLEEIEIMGSNGAVNVAVMEHYKLRQTQQDKVEKEKDLKALSDTGGPSGHQKLQVCDVCGAYLSRLDNDRRLADHFYGKMHLGYAQMRKTYEQIQKDLRARGQNPDQRPPDMAPPVNPEMGWAANRRGGPRGGGFRRGRGRW